MGDILITESRGMSFVIGYEKCVLGQCYFYNVYLSNYKFILRNIQ